MLWVSLLTIANCSLSPEWKKRSNHARTQILYAEKQTHIAQMNKKNLVRTVLYKKILLVLLLYVQANNFLVMWGQFTVFLG